MHRNRAAIAGYYDIYISGKRVQMYFALSLILHNVFAAELVYTYTRTYLEVYFKNKNNNKQLHKLNQNLRGGGKDIHTGIQ